MVIGWYYNFGDRLRQLSAMAFVTNKLKSFGHRMVKNKSNQTNWGFFEAVVKIGFGVAFGLLIYDALSPAFDLLSTIFGTITKRNPWWILIPLYLFNFVIILSAALAIPTFLVLPFFMINNKIFRGSFSKYPESWYEGNRNYLSFLVMWFFGFWALIFKFGGIS